MIFLSKKFLSNIFRVSVTMGNWNHREWNCRWQGTAECTHWEMIFPSLGNIHDIRAIFFFLMMRMFKIYSLSNFQICNTVLLTIVSIWNPQGPHSSCSPAEPRKTLTGKAFNIQNICTFQYNINPKTKQKFFFPAF